MLQRSPSSCPDMRAIDDALNSKVWDCSQVLRSEAACAASPRSVAAVEVATHTSRAALRPGDSSGVEKISHPGLRFWESSLDSVVMPGSACLSPPKTAWKHA